MNQALLSLLTGVTVAVISSITVLGAIWYKAHLDNNFKRLRNPSAEDKSMFYLEMDKVCNDIRESVKADGAYLAYFHNGGVFENGITMDKFTVVGEDYNDKVKCLSYKKLYSQTMITFMSYAYHRLVVNNRYCATTIDDVSDLSLKSDLVRRKVNSLYMYSIKNPVNDKPLGFFAVEYVDIYTMPELQETEVWKQQNKIARLLNMTVLK